MITIERALIEDAEVIMSVKISSFKKEYELYGIKPPNAICIDHQIKSIKETHYYKIMDNENIIGGMAVQDKGEGHFQISSIYIDLTYQNKGIGSFAMKFIEKEFLNAIKWSVETPYLSFSNHHFYEKMGFVKVGETEPEPDRNGFHLFLYEKQ